jgi:hypothetical protein
MKRNYVIGILLATLAFAGPARLAAQDNGPGSPIILLIPDGETVYDTLNQVTWLTDSNLPATDRFGLALCNPLVAPPPGEACVNASGSMNYASATAWVLAMNAARYLGHSDWQLPTT